MYIIIILLAILFLFSLFGGIFSIYRWIKDKNAGKKASIPYLIFAIVITLVGLALVFLFIYGLFVVDWSGSW
jgi:uncharacterized membrane protein YfcA